MFSAFSENAIWDVQHAAESKATLWEWRSFSVRGHAVGWGLSAKGSVQPQSSREQCHVQRQRQGSSQHRKWCRHQPRPETQLSSSCKEVTQEQHKKLFVLERKWGRSLFLHSVPGGSRTDPDWVWLWDHYLVKDVPVQVLSDYMEVQERVWDTPWCLSRAELRGRRNLSAHVSFPIFNFHMFFGFAHSRFWVRINLRTKRALYL